MQLVRDLLEINKGPDLYVKGLRDGMVKEKVFLDLLDLVNIICERLD